MTSFTFLSMAETLIEIDERCSTSGITQGFLPPCTLQSFNNDVLSKLFNNTLPTYLSQLRIAWEGIHEARISGHMPIAAGGPVDNCTHGGGMGHRFASRTRRTDSLPLRCQRQQGCEGKLAVSARRKLQMGASGAWQLDTCSVKWRRIGNHSVCISA